MKTFQELLLELDACLPARAWAADKTVEEVVEQCDRGDWLMWLGAKVKVDEKNFFLAQAHCSNTVRHLMKDERSVKAVDVAIAHGEGKASAFQLREAISDAHDAYMGCFDRSLSGLAAAYAAYSVAAYENTATYTIQAAQDAAIKASPDSAFIVNAINGNRKATADVCRKYIGGDIIKLVNQLLNKQDEEDILQQQQAG